MTRKKYKKVRAPRWKSSENYVLKCELDTVEYTIIGYVQSKLIVNFLLDITN